MFVCYFELYLSVCFRDGVFWIYYVFLVSFYHFVQLPCRIYVVTHECRNFF